jgi:hypothetical protein
VQRWDASLERRYLLCKARSIQDTEAAYLRAPARPLSGFLQARVVGGLALPRLVFRVLDKDQEQIALETREEKQATKRGKRAALLRMKIGKRRRYEGEVEMRQALATYILNDLPGELFIELMALLYKHKARSEEEHAVQA